MKLSQAIAKLTGGKAKVFGMLGGLALAGVAMTAAAPKADAQVAFGVRFGGPSVLCARACAGPGVPALWVCRTRLSGVRVCHAWIWLGPPALR